MLQEILATPLFDSGGGGGGGEVTFGVVGEPLGVVPAATTVIDSFMP